jgi:hypothetical protein
MLRESGEACFGFRTNDARHFVRAALETCESDAEVEQDLSGVTSAGYYNVNDTVATDARRSLLRDYPYDAPTIVLTEGISDRRALEGSLRLLYPHLSDLFVFMDFDAMKVPGGAGPLVATVKAFAAVGVANRIVALFDNDTAASDALRGLCGVALPSNVRVLRYPDIPRAASYPAQGPSGLQIQNVNGLAGSIELYFGEDVLRASGGELMPVQWGSYNAVLKKYQGELVDKVELNRRFERKLTEARHNCRQIEKLDWSGMRAILDALRTAFHTAEELILPVTNGRPKSDERISSVR